MYIEIGFCGRQVPRTEHGQERERERESEREKAREGEGGRLSKP